jgi:hypothetical protein
MLPRTSPDNPRFWPVKSYRETVIMDFMLGTCFLGFPFSSVLLLDARIIRPQQGQWGPALNLVSHLMHQKAGITRTRPRTPLYDAAFPSREG